ncbi:MAG TPA: RDD family protein [Opitutaceae bacterium]|nr:RDD family protein [Opitutaceae bacterium]
MKSFRHLLSTTTLAFLLALTPAALAQAQPAAAPADQPAATPAPDAPPAATPAVEAEPALRKLDTPAEPGTTTTPTPSARRRSRNHDNDHVAVGDNITLGKNQSATSVVAVLGSATTEGEVDQDVVSVLGGARVTGPVGHDVVAVLGNVYINSKIGGAVVAVMGDVELGPEAEIGREVVSVGGRVIRDPKAVVHGRVNNVPFGFALGNAEWLKAYITKCVMLARPLAVGPHLGWAWAVALGFLAFYLLLTLLFRGGIERCATTLETRPGYSVLAAVLTVLLAPLAIVLLCFTVVGIAIVPFLAAGLFFASLFGKATMLAWIGRRFTKFFGDGPLGHPVFAVLIGGIILLGLYMVPVVGFLTYKLLGWLGLGVVVYTIMQNMKREKAARAPVAATAGTAGVAGVAGVPFAPHVAPMSSAGFGAAAMPVTPGAEPVANFGIPGSLPPVVPASLPRAGLMLRLGGLLLDGVLVALIATFLNHLLPRGARFDPPGFLPLLAIYGAVMWKLKGTTIGGIVCGLKTVRIDGREIDWATAVVRALSCFLSLAVAGLGFIWIAFDDERQAWHDKIAGTIVVRVPKGTSLV